MATIDDFKNYRSKILKNSIYNRILISILNGKTLFTVASTLKLLEPQTRNELSKDDNKKKIPKYALYDIYLKINNNHFFVGIQYKAHTIIWQYFNLSPKSIKSLVEFIYKHYSINPSKSDKIFATIPDDVKLFFSDYSYSDNFWKLGFSKKTNPQNHNQLNKKIINNYLEELKKRNLEYRAFNNILLTMLKSNIYVKTTKQGTVLVQKSLNSQELYLKFNYQSEVIYDDFYPINTFTPIKWDTSKMDAILFN